MKPQKEVIPVPCVLCPRFRPDEDPSITMNGICRWCRGKA